MVRPDHGACVLVIAQILTDTFRDYCGSKVEGPCSVYFRSQNVARDHILVGQLLLRMLPQH